MVTQYVIMVGLIDHVLEHCLIHFPYADLFSLAYIFMATDGQRRLMD